MHRSRSKKYGMKFLRPGLPIPAHGQTRHVPIEILVHAFNGKIYTLFTENKDETIGDVKRCLLSNLDYLSILREIQLVSGDVKKGYEDHVKVSELLLKPLSNRTIELILLKVQPVWTRDEQNLIDEIKREKNTVRLKDDHRLEVFRWILKNESNITTIIGNDIRQPVIFDMIIDAIKNPDILLNALFFSVIYCFDMTKFSRALLDNTSIRKLQVAECGFNCDEMQIFFDMIAGNVGLKRIMISSIDIMYRMKDLVNSLQTNNTLRAIYIYDCQVVATEEDIVNLINILGKHTVTNLHLTGRNSSNSPFDLVRLDELIRQRKGEWLDPEFKVDRLNSLIENYPINLIFQDSDRVFSVRISPTR